MIRLNPFDPFCILGHIQAIVEFPIKNEAIVNAAIFEGLTPLRFAELIGNFDFFVSIGSN